MSITVIWTKKAKRDDWHVEKSAKIKYMRAVEILEVTVISATVVW